MRDNFDVYEWNIRKIREEKNISGDEAVTKTIEFLRKSIYPKLTDDEMDKFVVGICEFMDCTPPTYRLNEDENTLNKISDILSRKFDDLDFNVNTLADRIDVKGSQQDLMNFGSESHGKKIFDYEVFHTNDDDRGEIVRIIKSDSISRGGVNEEEKKKADRCLRIARRKMPQSSAYRSGLIVKCRKGMIWKKEK